MKSFSDSYKAAGVDVTAGYRAVELPAWGALAACLRWIFPA